jgi:hypothetical protein
MISAEQKGRFRAALDLMDKQPDTARGALEKLLAADMPDGELVCRESPPRGVPAPPRDRRTRLEK